MRISDWSSDVCSSDLVDDAGGDAGALGELGQREGRIRCLGRRLDDHRAAGRQRRRALAGDHGVGEVPRRDRRYHADRLLRSEEHTSELQSLMRISYAVFCLKKKNTILSTTITYKHNPSNLTQITHITNTTII